MQDGTAHCIIVWPEFYTLATNGVPFAAWLDALLNEPAPPAEALPSF